ncbi:MAG: Lysine-tRNA ligase [Candidatus Woesebacteria bacterium GW2011_GWB1_38_5]|uniref:Lysine--tRNA ligase n=4 Tax=Candidatus Woeseibacteriota TaxID=1752722 RepID=A0A0G0MGZ9_9BACT|nr:MAG: Lysine-tRNA ligase [Candidatus Woesebacteria bacterium GW2011_GWD1_38_10]KKQ55197.1 MAG: lysyl-tRNA synthetase, lysyl-tRNA synthetase, class II [Candidatus Woesebacteria bacterium GW2011_GWC1_38_13]KKQ73034.1 MAG: Lysine-tRNA ligase [Candidatus Woesebacteria bacterium GW2011_GWB1_38_5]KKQ83361.1 MAG: Lysine-tRNA ligase [Candidatus Woesebacteria bacterium GW2011_GWA1_38_8]
MSEQKLEEIRNIRLEKIKKLIALGINPYPSKPKEGIEDIADAREKLEQDVMVAGRVMSIRGHGNVAFFDLKDETGKIQLWFQKDKLADSYKITELLDVGDILYAKGIVTKTKAGEISIDVNDFQLLSKSIRPLPSTWFGLKDVEERYRQRYVDLILNEEARKIFDLRTGLVTEIRKFMDSKGFREVETPILQPIYGGASAQPFTTHHNALDTDLYLRISDELYLKRLIVGGYRKVYEIGHVFRNEGIDRAHNPEFTMMEFYWAYANYEDLMTLTEEMLSTIINKLTGSYKVQHEDDLLDFTPPWPRVKFRDLLLEKTGIDIDATRTEVALKKEINGRKLKFDLKGVVGYGALCDKLYKEYIRPSLVQPQYLVDYPSAMIALAKKKEENPHYISSVQLLVKGYEIIKAYNELNDPVDQKDRWLEEERLGKKGLEDHMVLDEDYIRALEYGMPPTAGWGMGIDRLVSILTNQHSLKEVILFPTLRPEK